MKKIVLLIIILVLPFAFFILIRLSFINGFTSSANYIIGSNHLALVLFSSAALDRNKKNGFN
jgi:hypothetical protein